MRSTNEQPGVSIAAPQACPPAEAVPCAHCGTPCPDGSNALGGKLFCCQGCQVVYELLAEHGLDHFYALEPAPGPRMSAQARDFTFLDDPAVRRRLITFSDGQTARARFRVGAIHCLACVWLLENLFRLNPGIGASRVNFPRKEVSISFDETRLRLSEVVKLLAGIGYEPDLTLADLDQSRPVPVGRKLWLQLGVAGFAFGNIMLLSFPAYLGLDGSGGPGLKRLFAFLSLALAVPVAGFSASDYWRAAWRCVKQRVLTIDLPIALGIAALLGQSAFEILTGRGDGFCDSLAGLVFFLLCGKLFQQKTFDRLAFDRDYKSFFPLSVIRKRGASEETVSLSELKVGDHLVVRHGELIPADALIVSGSACVDYSFVTGESEPVVRNTGDYLYAGGQQVGGVVDIEVVKPVSQSYLTSLWSHEAFKKPQGEPLNSMTNRLSGVFTRLVIAIAAGAALYWCFQDPSRAVKAFTAVLIVACPCALALAAPFALGTAQRVLARRNIFIKSPLALETLARADAIVFDKTGTLTHAAPGGVRFDGKSLDEKELRSVSSLVRQSAHPVCVRLSRALGGLGTELVRGFAEVPGRGIEGRVNGHKVRMGSREWVSEDLEIRNPKSEIRKKPEIRNSNAETEGAGQLGVRNSDVYPGASSVHVSINGEWRGVYALANALRPQAEQLIRELGGEYELALLSGDNPAAREQFRGLFGPHACIRFNQNPFHKLDFIRDLQQQGRTVVMVGDGLNDAGALAQSNIGIAVVESIGAFSPASDVIMEAAWVPRLGEILRFSKTAMRIVRASFLISVLYNVVGLSFAARGMLSPVTSAILMPLSSVSVVAFACLATGWFGRRLGVPFGSGEDLFRNQNKS